MDTVIIKTKETTPSSLPYIDEQRLYFKTRGSSGVLLVSLWVSTENVSNTSKVSIIGGEFLDGWTGSSVGVTKTLSTGNHSLYIRINTDASYLSIRDSQVVVSFGFIATGVSADLCLQRMVDGNSTPYMDIYITSFPYGISSLLTTGASSYSTAKPAIVLRGDINDLTNYPNLVFIGIGTARDNGTIELSTLYGELTTPLSPKLMRFIMFPTLIATTILYDKVSVHLSAFSGCTLLPELALYGVKLYGTLSQLQNLKELKILALDSISNNITGSLDDLLQLTKLESLRYLGQTNLQGGLNSLPPKLTSIIASYQTSISTYTTRNWGTVMQTILMPRCELPTGQLDQLLVDLSAVTTWTGLKAIQLKGSPSGTGLTAITTLQSKGVTVTLY